MGVCAPYGRPSARVGAQLCPRLYSASGSHFARTRWAWFVYTGALSDALTGTRLWDVRWHLCICGD